MSNILKQTLLQGPQKPQKLKGAFVGTYDGLMVSDLLETIPDLFVHCVDPWNHLLERENDYFVNNKDDYYFPYAKAKEILEKFKLRSKIIKGFFDEVSYSFKDESLDFVYFNNYGCCRMKQNDLFLWIPKIKDNGFICGNGFFVSLEDDIFSNKVLKEENEWKISPVDEKLRIGSIAYSKRQGD